MIKEYFELTKQYELEYGKKSIVFYQCGAFFECYGLKTEKETIFGSNVVEFGRICDLAVVDKKVCVGANPVVMAGFKDHLLEKYIKKMQDTGYTVIVFEQDNPGPNTTRSLTGIYSPGTYFSTDDNQKITNNTCCIWIDVKKPTLKSLEKHIYIGVSQIDIYSGKTSLMEYDEVYSNNPTTFDKLEHLISIYNPCETILIYNHLTKKDVDNIVTCSGLNSKTYHFIDLSTSGILIDRANNCEKQTYQVQLLTNLYSLADVQSFMAPFNQSVYATQSFCYLLDFMYQHNPNLIYKISEPTIETVTNQLRLANHSVKQLNIIGDDNFKGKYSSLVSMLNECVTPMGKREFAHLLLNPITDIPTLQNEYNMTKYLLVDGNNNSSSFYNGLRELMMPLVNIDKINRQLMDLKISPRTIYKLFQSLRIINKIYDIIIEKNGQFVSYMQTKIPYLQELFLDITNSIQTLDNIFIIDECVDIENVSKCDTSFIKQGVDLELDFKLKGLMDAQDQLDVCKKYFSDLISKYEKPKSKSKTKLTKDDVDTETEYVKIYETEKSNYSLLSTDRRCKILNEELKKLGSDSVVLSYNSSYLSGKEQTFCLHLNSTSNKITFEKYNATNNFITSNQIDKMCSDIGTIKKEFKDIISTSYTKIVTKLKDLHNKLDRISEFIIYLDLICCKAFIAEKYNYCCPEISIDNTKKKDENKSFLKATGLRHCIIERINDTEIYVANDVELGLNNGNGDDTNNGKMDGMLLYGTNAVGKTSFIRSVGIAVIMAQAGLFVPASTFIYYPYQYIFTRILGNDNMFKGQSTFTVEMSELRTILLLGNKNSLVLGDELCSGTESGSATSIFVSGVQQLSEMGCSFIFATHWHEIVDYDEITELKSVHLKHMSVIYNRELDTLVYDRKLMDGPGDNMYGLEVCKSLNLPRKFLENANNIRMKYQPMAGSLLDNKTSRYNSKHIKGMCGQCGVKMATEVHHLYHQQDADVNGIIKTEDGKVFHKNHAANLLSLCESCHDKMHKTGEKPMKKKTIKGNTILHK